MRSGLTAAYVELGSGHVPPAEGVGGDAGAAAGPVRQAAAGAAAGTFGL